MPVSVLLGLQWGDEGKGKVVDVLGDRVDVVARFQGGPNAGHTIIIGGQKYVLHQIPSGIFRPGVRNIIGNGVVINPAVLLQEIRGLEAKGVDVRSHLYISTRCHLILPSHVHLDKLSEQRKGQAKIGSTLRGIGPTYRDKYGREGLRMGDVLTPRFAEKLDTLQTAHYEYLHALGYAADRAADTQAFLEALEALKAYTITDTEVLLHKALAQQQHILAEGAQGTLLDVEFGAYPFVTSSNTTAGGACTGLGIPPSAITQVYGVFKAYCTRVGSGPFPTELDNAQGEAIRQAGGEFGATTGRPRRTGWLDLPALKYACSLNGVTHLVMTKADVLAGMDHVEVCVGYELNGRVQDYPPFDSEGALKPVYRSFPGWPGFGPDDALPVSFRQYLDFIEAELGQAITFVSMGPDRKEMVQLVA
ncbi:MAG: adenylosuccinate synthase [Bacteroidetes bacterium]|nr:adenylosuccinate synthase [Bacteroidota bacterium]